MESTLGRPERSGKFIGCYLSPPSSSFALHLNLPAFVVAMHAVLSGYLVYTYER